MKKRKVYKNKGYTHFDARKPEYWKYINNIKNPKWIERHAFYPFIYILGKSYYTKKEQ